MQRGGSNARSGGGSYHAGGSPSARPTADPVAARLAAAVGLRLRRRLNRLARSLRRPVVEHRPPAFAGPFTARNRAWLERRRKLRTLERWLVLVSRVGGGMLRLQGSLLFVAYLGRRPLLARDRGRWCVVEVGRVRVRLVARRHTYLAAKRELAKEVTERSAAAWVARCGPAAR